MTLTKIGSIGVSTGIQFAGVTTIATLNASDNVLSVGGTVNFVSDVSIGGSVSIGGTLTYEDVTNIDAVGLITARDGIEVTDKGVQVGTGATVDSASANILTFLTNGSERARINASGKVLINHTAARGIGGSQYRQLQIEGTSAGDSGISMVRNSADASPPSLNLGKSRASSVGGNTIVQDDDVLGTITFAGADGTNLQTNAAEIRGEVDGTPGENDMPGRIVFKTTADGASSTTERVRITSTGRLLVATTTSSQQGADGYIQSVVAGTSLGAWGSHAGSTGNRKHMRFSNPNGVVGSINTQSSGTSFNTSSDYRLKENQTAISDAISRINQLKPYTFNFKANPSEKIDGFFAHEAQELIPYAVEGEKDGEEMQSIDYGKLTPLLTAALQEAAAKIEVLESEVAALKSS